MRFWCSRIRYVAADVDDVAVVQQPVDEGRGHDLVAEHAAPFLEALVGGEHGGGALVAGVDELEEEHGAVLADGQVADLVHHEQGRMSQHTEPSGELARGLGIDERLDKRRQGSVVDAAAGFGGGDGQAYGQVRFPDSRPARHILPVITVAR